MYNYTYYFAVIINTRCITWSQQTSHSSQATLKIQRAWALPDRTNAPFNNPKPDPYVVVHAKNRIWGEVYRTETKKAATDPTWDESFVLEKQLG